MEGNVIIYAVALWYSSYNRWGEKQNTLLKLWVSLSFRGTLVFTDSHFTAFLPLVFVIRDFFFKFLFGLLFYVLKWVETKSCWQTEIPPSQTHIWKMPTPPRPPPFEPSSPFQGRKENLNREKEKGWGGGGMKGDPLIPQWPAQLWVPFPLLQINPVRKTNKQTEQNQKKPKTHGWTFNVAWGFYNSGSILALSRVKKKKKKEKKLKRGERGEESLDLTLCC